jgi:hypothetical protein
MDKGNRDGGQGRTQGDVRALGRTRERGDKGTKGSFGRGKGGGRDQGLSPRSVREEWKAWDRTERRLRRAREGKERERVKTRWGSGKGTQIQVYPGGKLRRERQRERPKGGRGGRPVLYTLVGRTSGQSGPGEEVIERRASLDGGRGSRRKALGRRGEGKERRWRARSREGGRRPRRTERLGSRGQGGLSVDRGKQRYQTQRRGKRVRRRRGVRTPRVGKVVQGKNEKGKRGM